MVELLGERQHALADYSVPPEKCLPGDIDQVRQGLERRISSATAVVVVNTPGLHQRETSSWEMQTAVDLGKRIVVLQPPGAPDAPIPGVLDGHIYKVAPWRSDVLGKAIRGEYPAEHRTFDLAEAADVRKLVQVVAVLTSACSVGYVLGTRTQFLRLQDDLAREGVVLVWSGVDTEAVVRDALIGALGFGSLAALATEDARTAGWAALFGLAVGASIGVERRFRAVVASAGANRVLRLEPA
jgi:hypothetical protein